MADSNCTTQPAADVSNREMLVNIRPCQLDFWEFEGTRAQLEGENVIPPNTEWPQGASTLYWRVGKFRYGLNRKRPAGIKGPMSVWCNGDWWNLRCEVYDLRLEDYRIWDQKRELAKSIYRATERGQYEWRVEYSRCCKARDDAEYQRFRSIFIPEKKKPTRKPRAAKAA